MNKIRYVKESVECRGVCRSNEASLLERIEECGRLAWKSEHKAGPDTAWPFVKGLIRKRHLNVLEHSNICLHFSGAPWAHYLYEDLGYRASFHKIVIRGGDQLTISGSLRAWMETIWHFKEYKPVDLAIFLPALQRFYPTIFGECTEDPLYCSQVQLLSEERQLGIMQMNPELDLAGLNRGYCYKSREAWRD